jgi:UDP-N-acetylglucosamine--N-acetylmuramyl-(pentapeptide) pyrophosphoryl-undecaprenol N-acetylglucosamine transferase
MEDGRLYHGRRRVVAIAAGGTAGHVYPALAVADAWRGRGTDVVFAGTQDGAEAGLVPAHGYRLAYLRAAPLFGTGPLGRVRALTALVAGTRDARTWLRTERPAVVLGFGGYAGAGAVLGAWTLGIPTAIHEANAAGGVANRLLARVSDRVLLGFGEAAGDFPAGKTAITGTPVRAAIAAAARHRTTSDSFRVLVLGGSLGSPFLNARVPDLLARVARAGVPLWVRHQTGRHPAAPVAAAYRSAGVPADVLAYDDRLAAAYCDADFAIACAGASTLVELAARDGRARSPGRERARLRGGDGRLVDDGGRLGGRGAGGPPDGLRREPPGSCRGECPPRHRCPIRGSRGRARR